MIELKFDVTMQEERWSEIKVRIEKQRLIKDDVRIKSKWLKETVFEGNWKLERKAMQKQNQDWIIQQIRNAENDHSRN